MNAKWHHRCHRRFAPASVGGPYAPSMTSSGKTRPASRQFAWETQWGNGRMRKLRRQWRGTRMHAQIWQGYTVRRRKMETGVDRTSAMQWLRKRRPSQLLLSCSQRRGSVRIAAKAGKAVFKLAWCVVLAQDREGRLRVKGGGKGGGKWGGRKEEMRGRAGKVRWIMECYLSRSLHPAARHPLVYIGVLVCRQAGGSKVPG